MGVAPVQNRPVQEHISDAQRAQQITEVTRTAFAGQREMFARLSGMIRSSAVTTSGTQVSGGGRVVAPDGTWTSTSISPSETLRTALPNPSAPGQGNAAYPDRAQNGTAHRITTTNRTNGVKPPVIFINGINTSLSGARETAASVGELTGTDVDLVYNSSDPAVGARVTLGHFHNVARERAEEEASKGIRWTLRHGLELPFMVRARVYRETMTSAAFGQEGGEWAKYNALNNPPASTTAVNLIIDQLNSHEGPVNVAGYSQGGAIAADALRRVEDHLVANHGRAKADELLARVRFLGIGAAAEVTDFPAAVRFSGIAHRGDVVPEYFGISRNRRAPGLGAILKALTPGNGFGVEQHVNYLDDQHGVGSEGDPLSETLLRNWFSGVDIGARVIRDNE